MAITLKGSKMDQGWVGTTLYVDQADNGLCPISALLPYLVTTGPDPGPLFRLADGTLLTRSRLVTLLRATLAQMGFECTQFSGHSF